MGEHSRSRFALQDNPRPRSPKFSRSLSHSFAHTYDFLFRPNIIGTKGGMSSANRRPGRLSQLDSATQPAFDRTRTLRWWRQRAMAYGISLSSFRLFSGRHREIGIGGVGPSHENTLNDLGGAQPISKSILRARRRAIGIEAGSNHSTKSAVFPTFVRYRDS
jgi:hypothetical protein